MSRPIRRFEATAAATAWKRKQLQQCAVCTATTNLRVHHIRPVMTGGTDEPGNLLLLCKECHDKAHKLFHQSGGRYYGPTDKADLTAALTDPDAWFLERKRQLVMRLRQ